MLSPTINPEAFQGRRGVFLSTAMDLFSRYGYREVSIQGICKRLGVSVGTFYNYFDSKEQCYSHVLDVIEQEGIRKADRLVARLHSPLNKLKAVYRFTTLGLKQNKILRGILVGDEKYLYPGLVERNLRQRSLRAHIEQLLRDIIREGTQKGVFRSGLYNDPAGMVITIFDTVIQNSDSDASDDLTDDLLVFVQRGLRRVLRLRRREERWDRRLMRNEEEDTYLE